MTYKPTPKEMDDLFVEETGFDIDDFPAAIFDFARAVLEKWGSPAVKGDPVAWLSPWRKDQVTTDYDAYGKHGIPLYAAPQPVALEPLTPERLREIERMCVYANTATLIDFARAIERAHGIKKRDPHVE